MQPKKIYCTQCGAEIPPGQAQCPYCGSAYAPEAEREYMRKLDHVRSELDNVGNIGEETSRNEIDRIRRRVIRILAGILIFAAAMYGLMFFLQTRENRDNRKEYTWQKENLPALEQLYEEGDYDALLEAYEKALEEGHTLYDWKYSTFCEVYKSKMFVDEILQMREEGVFEETDAIMLLHHELRFRGIRWSTGITEEDLEVIRDLVAPYENDLVEIFHASQEDLDTFDAELKKYRGFPNYDSCEAYVKDHPEILMENKHR